ncbi:MAG: ATP-binding protein [Bacteroidaceae bacterium]|nr:ATP-binding protein [Bacteroidaceae bacterium]MCF0222171.1 ATP-binding protein [Fibrobacter sp.]
MQHIGRTLKKRITDSMFKGKAIILVGARQVGKSTLFGEIVGESGQSALVLNGDEPEVREVLANVNTAELRMLIGDHRIVLIDEAQRVRGIGLTLKRITDNYPDVQLLVTGSSSLDLHNSLDEPLTGRKLEYNLFPISTAELLATEGLMAVKQTLANRLIYGSYPEVLTTKGDVREVLMNLAGSYLYKDLLQDENIRKPVLLEKILVALALQIGSEVSYNELAQTIGSDSKTVEKYIDLLERCFVVFRLNALNRNVRTELKKGKKIFFYDNGIRNAVLQNFAPLDLRSDKGALWENFVISERMKRNHYARTYARMYFWRTTDQQEIDYVEECDGRFSLFEMKANPRKSSTSFPSLFLRSYDIASTIVVTPDNYLDVVV